MEAKVILDAARNREEISSIEALMLLQEGASIQKELVELGRHFNSKLHGKNVTFVRAKQVHYTNVCRAECSFCSFAKKKGQRGAFTLTAAELVRQVRDSGVRQVNLQGGLNPDLPPAYHIDVVRTLKEEFPNIHLHGYSPSEIWFVARRARMSPQEFLKKLHHAGLDSLSGDSADILNDKLRKKICADKIRTNDWIELIKTAHRLGITTTATVLFGHVEDEIQLSEHLDIIKSIQKETGGITAFEPIPFVPQRTELAHDKRCRRPLSIDYVLRVIAISRIFLFKSVRNIQIDWTKLGLPAALRCLDAGANDIGPTAFDQHEIRTPSVNGKLSIPTATLRSSIQKTGHTPVDREPYSMKSLPPRPRREEPVLV